MKVKKLNTGLTKFPLNKSLGLICFENKYYLDLLAYGKSDCITELCIALGEENNALKEEIKALEKIINGIKRKPATN